MSCCTPLRRCLSFAKTLSAGKRFGIASRAVLNQGSVGGLRNQTEPRCHGRYQARIVAPTLHPGITEEVAPNESQRDPKRDDVRSANLRGVVCGALAPVLI